jgi:hypothetical protein
LDKSHPNIWIAEKLKMAFPESLFVGIERNPYATVASMMEHKGVSAWHKRWREFPIPNRFLGITEEMAEIYDDVPLASQCAMRWIAHYNRMKELRKNVGDSLMVISYESFSSHPERTLYALQQFLQLHDAIRVPKVKTESLDRWKRRLSAEALKQIQDIVGFPPDRFNDEGVDA